MSSARGHQNTRVITYSRKSCTKPVSTSSGSQVDPRTSRTATNEAKRSFWDFSASSEDEESLKEIKVKPLSVPSKVTSKRKANEIVVERVEKKPLPSKNGRSRSTTPVDAQRQVQAGNGDAKGHPSKTFTPRKSNLIVRSSMKPASPPRKSVTPQPPSPLPHPSTPKPKIARQASASPNVFPKGSITPQKRSLPLNNSSPLSSPPSSNKSLSQPLPPATTPRSRIASHSHSFNDFSSPRMTPSQEKTWESLSTIPGASPSRRRLVDRLREQVTKSPQPPPTPSLPLVDPAPSTNIDNEISRVLEYNVPVIDSRPARKEPSQSDSQGTYLSRSRSFLAEPSSFNNCLGFADLDDLIGDTAATHPVDELEEELDPGVKSWYELKRGGVDKRLLDEMEDLVEEARTGGHIGVRRSSVVEIGQKLLGDASWRRKFKSFGLFSTFISNVRDVSSDPVFSLCI